MSLGSDANKAVDPVDLICVEFFVSAVISLPVAIVYESEEWEYPYTLIVGNMGPLVLIGITEGLAFTFSNMGQQYTEAARYICAIVMSFLFMHLSIRTHIHTYIIYRDLATNLSIYMHFVYLGVLYSCQWNLYLHPSPAISSSMRC